MGRNNGRQNTSIIPGRGVRYYDCDMYITHTHTLHIVYVVCVYIVYVCVCIYIYTYICMYVYVCIYICVCVCVFVYVCAHIHPLPTAHGIFITGERERKQFAQVVTVTDRAASYKVKSK